MNVGDQVIYTWSNWSRQRNADGVDIRGQGHTAPGKILRFSGKTKAVVEFAKGGQRVEQTVPLAKLTLKEDAA